VLWGEKHPGGAMRKGRVVTQAGRKILNEREEKEEREIQKKKEN